jgi:hypothetical protein
MPVKVPNYLELTSRPSWDLDGGKWYVSQTPPANGEPRKMYRHKPSMHLLCEPLLGSSIRNAAGKIVGVRYPTLSRRMEIYREGIELISVFMEKSDVFALAVYRRYVTQRGGVPIDLLLFNLALDLNFSVEDWEMLRVRMPDKAPIYDACFRRAHFGKLQHAAE